MLDPRPLTKAEEKLIATSSVLDKENAVNLKRASTNKKTIAKRKVNNLFDKALLFRPEIGWIWKSLFYGYKGMIIFSI